MSENFALEDNIEITLISDEQLLAVHADASRGPVQFYRGQAYCQPSPCILSQGKISKQEHLEVPEVAGIWALGDCAAVPDSRTGRSYPPTAQNAIRQGTPGRWAS